MRTSIPTAEPSVAHPISDEVRSSITPDLLSVPRAKTLDELESQFTAIVQSVQELIASTRCELCLTSPEPGSWSAAQCIQHLNASTDAYFSIWQQVISNAPPRRQAPSAPYRTDFWGRLLSWILEPPARIRSTTPVPFEPLDCNEIDPVLEGFVDRQARIVAALRRCRGRAVDDVKMCSPIDPRMKYSIWSSFLINAAHQRRHLWQAWQAIRKVRLSR